MENKSSSPQNWLSDLQDAKKKSLKHVILQFQGIDIRMDPWEIIENSEGLRGPNNLKECTISRGMRGSQQQSSVCRLWIFYERNHSMHNFSITLNVR